MGLGFTCCPQSVEPNVVNANGENWALCLLDDPGIQVKDPMAGRHLCMRGVEFLGWLRHYQLLKEHRPVAHALYRRFPT
jgi:hypothetical protein